MSERTKITLVQKKIIKSLLYGSYDIMNMFYARIHTCGKQSEYWIYSGLEGALIYCIDIRVKSYRFLMIDLKSYEIVFDCELYKRFDKAYKKGTERFYYFEVENGFIGFEIPNMEQAEILSASIISFGDDYIKKKIKEYKTMKENEIKEKAEKMIELLEKKLKQDNSQPKMLRAEIALKHGLLEKMINTVELDDQSDKIIIKGNGYNGYNSDLLKLKGLNLDMRTDLKIGDGEIFTKYISRNILRSYMKGLIIPKRKINRGEGVAVEKVPQYEEKPAGELQEEEKPKTKENKKRKQAPMPQEPIRMEPKEKPQTPPSSPKNPKIEMKEEEEEVRPPSPPKMPKIDKKEEVKPPSPPKMPKIEKKKEVKPPSPPKMPKIEKKKEVKPPSPPKMPKIEKKEEVNPPSSPSNEVVEIKAKGIPPPPPPPPPPPVVKTIPTSSKSSKPIDLAAELAAKKKNLSKVETKDLSIPNVQKNDSSSSPQTGNSMMALIAAQRNAMKKKSASKGPSTTESKATTQPKKPVEQPPKPKKPVEQPPKPKKPVEQPPKPKNIQNPASNTNKVTAPKNPVTVNNTKQSLEKPKANNNKPPASSGAKPPMKLGGKLNFAAMLESRMGGGKSSKKVNEEPKKPIVELASGSNVPRMNMSKLMASLESNLGKSNSSSDEPVQVVSGSGAGIPPPPPPPPLPPSK